MCLCLGLCVDGGCAEFTKEPSTGRLQKGSVQLGDVRVSPPVSAALGDARVSPPVPAALGDARMSPPVSAALGDARMSPPVSSALGDARVSPRSSELESLRTMVSRAVEYVTGGTACPPPEERPRPPAPPPRPSPVKIGPACPPPEERPRPPPHPRPSPVDDESSPGDVRVSAPSPVEIRPVNRSWKAAREGSVTCDLCAYTTERPEKLEQHARLHVTQRLVCKICRRACLKVNNIHSLRFYNALL